MKKAKTAQSQEQKTLFKNWNKYKGYIVMVVGNKIFATKSGERAAKLVKEIEQKYHRRPLTTVIPKEGFWILPNIKWQ